MKRIALYLGIAVALVVSCSTQEKDFQTPLQDEAEFFASFEQPGEEESRVYANEDLLLRWTADDRVSIFNKLTYNQQYKFTGETGDNAGGFKKVDTDEFVTGNAISHVVSVYPYQETTKITESEVLTVILPAEQTYAQNTFGLGANTMVSVSSDNILQYKTIGGYLVFKLYGEGVSVSSITLKGNNGEKIAGKATVSMPIDGVPTATMADDATTEITLTCPEPVKLGATAEESTQFWFVVPQVTFSKGFTIAVNQSTGGCFEKSTAKSITIERNKLSKMSPMEVEVSNIHPASIPEAIDLGLSVKWASFNLGASAPEEYGDYYAWGETEPYYISQDPLIWKEGKEAGYSWASYRWCMGDYSTLTKYCTDTSFGHNGFTDNKRVLDPEDDAAYVNLGGSWRIPTDAEWTELRENCTWTWTTRNGVYGRIVTGPNGNSLFLPAAGNRDDTSLYNVGSSGYYWSSSLYAGSHLAWNVYFNSDNVSRSSYFRNYGFPIRPVHGDSIVSVTGVSLDKTSLSIAVGDTQTLFSTVLPENATNKTVTWSSGNTSVATVSSNGVVTGVGAGTTTITVTTTDGGKTATCEVTVNENSSPSMEVPEAIDLGLSVKWASFNLGASAPEEYGDYFTWGETELYYSSQDPLTWKEGKENGYSWASYRWCMGDYNRLTKYCNNSEWGYNGFMDNKTVLDPEDDAASVNLGGKWRMPTDAEWTELRKNCTWTWTTQNGVNGRLITASNGNSIFLPAADRRDDTNFDDSGSSGYYWSSSLYTEIPNLARRVIFGSDRVNEGGSPRCFGLSIRPVYGDPAFSVESVILDKTELELFVGESSTLTAAVLPDNATNKTVTWSSSNISVATVSSSGVVAAVSSGFAVITVTTIDGGKTATCTITVTEPSTVAAPEAVDLGLSVKWASFNLGATKPEEYGDYFAWGDTKPFLTHEDLPSGDITETGNGWWESYKWCMGTENSMIKYCTDPSWGYNGFTDNKTELDPEDDAAHVHLGGNWRMPTEDEQYELRTKCTWVWTSINDISGYLFTGPNGNSIFIPAAGFWWHSTLNYVGSRGYYWSLTLDTKDPWAGRVLYFTPGTYVGWDATGRYRGQPIRPVYAE